MVDNLPVFLVAIELCYLTSLSVVNTDSVYGLARPADLTTVYLYSMPLSHSKTIQPSNMFLQLGLQYTVFNMAFKKRENQDASLC